MASNELKYSGMSLDSISGNDCVYEDGIPRPLDLIVHTKKGWLHQTKNISNISNDFMSYTSYSLVSIWGAVDPFPVSLLSTSAPLPQISSYASATDMCLTVIYNYDHSNNSCYIQNKLQIYYRIYSLLWQTA